METAHSNALTKGELANLLDACGFEIDPGACLDLLLTDLKNAESEAAWFRLPTM